MVETATTRGFWRRIMVVGLIWLAMGAMTSLRGEAAAGEPEPKRILYLCSYNAFFRWTRDMVESFQQFWRGEDIPVEIDVVELNVARNPDWKPLARDVEWSRERILSGNYDLVVASGNAAVEMCLEHYEELPETTSLLVAACIGDVGNLPRLPRMTGLLLDFSSVERNIELGMRLLPETRRVVVVTDGGPDGLAVAGHVESLRGRWGDAIELEQINGADCTTGEMLEALESLPSNALIVFDNWWEERTKSFQPFSAVGGRERPAITSPVLVSRDTAFDEGVLGGIMTTGRNYGRETAALAKRILAGGRADDIPFEVGSSQAVFQWPQVERWRPDPAALPSEAIFLNRPPSFLTLYFWPAVAGAATIGGLVLAVVFLAVHYRNNRKLQAVFDLLPVCVTAVDAMGRVRLLQGRDRPVRNEPGRIGHLTDLPAGGEIFQAPVRQVLETMQPVSKEYRRDGRYRYAEFRHLPKKIFGVETVLWVSTDITELHLAREEIVRTAERFRLTLNSIGDGVLATDAEETVTICNPVAARLTGYPVEKIVGRKLDEIFRIVHYPDDGPVESPVARALRTGRTVELANHTDLLAGDGRRYHIADSAAPIVDRAGRIDGAVLVFRDVTQEYEGRDRMQMNNIFLNSAADIAALTYFRCDADGRVLSAREGYEALWRKCGDRPAAVEDWVLPEDLPEFLDGWRRLLAGEKHELRMVYRSAAEGKMRYFEMRAVEDETPVAGRKVYFGIIQDITVDKENELKYRDTLTLLQNIMANLPCYIFVKDVDAGLRYLMCNRAFAEIVSHPEEEIIGRTDAEIFGQPENAEKFREDDLKLVQSGRLLDEREQFIAGDGSPHTVRILKCTWRQASGRRLLLGMGLDISTQVRMEEELKENNALLLGILDHLPALIATKDMRDFRYALWNKKAEEITGIPAAEVIGRTDFEIDHFVGDPGRFREEDLEVRASGQLKNIVGALQTVRDGRKYVMQTMKTPLALGDGRSLLLTMSVDITERQRLEEEQRRLTETLQLYAEQQRLVNSCLERILLREDAEEAVSDILSIIGSQIGADRCYICRYDYRRAVCDNTHEWTAAGILSEQNELQGVPIEMTEDWNRLLRCRQLVCCGNLAGEGVPLKSATLELLRRQGIQSIIAAGIWLDEELWGFLGVDFVRSRRAFSEGDRNIIAAAAHIIEIYLERRHGLEELLQSENEKRQIFDNIDTPILLFDADFNFIRANRAAYRAYRAEERAGEQRPCYEIFCKQSAVPDYCPVRKTIETGTVHRRSLHVDNSDYIIVTKPIFDADGKLAYVLESAMDVSELNAQQRRLQAAMEAAQAADRTKSSFLATMSHELRTPLNAVIGFSELMQAGGMTPEEQQDSLKAINFAGNTLLKLINDILDLSKLEADQLEISLQPVDLRKLVQETVQLFKPGCREHRSRIELEVPERLPMLLLDQIRLRQVLLNLIGNAVKFTDDGVIRIGVTLAGPADGSGGVLTLWVSDTGSGIAKAYQESIFEPFKQQHIPGNRIYQGTGLGLPITKRMVAKMGGEISLRSELGEGSTFTVVLRGVQCAEPAPVADARPEKAAPAGLPGGKILIVDDVPMNLKVLAAMLKKLGWEAIACQSAEEALARAARETPAMVLTDLWMPGMNGGTLAARLAAHPATAGIPVVVITADTQMDFVPAERFAGVLFKPLTLEKLRAAIGNAAGGIAFAERADR